MMKIDGCEKIFRAEKGLVFYKRDHGYQRYVVSKVNLYDGSVFEGKYFDTLEAATNVFERLIYPKAEVFITMEGGIIQDIGVHDKFAGADVYTIYVDEDDWEDDQPVLTNEDGSKIQVVRNGQYDVTQEEWDNFSQNS